MSDHTNDRFTCPRSKSGESVRWDICLNRHLESKMSKKRRDKCRNCEKPGQFVKGLVMEIL
jgi:hypothetical protein